MMEFFAKAGESEVVYMHGTIYSNGLGVPQDDVKAYKLMSRAAALGNASALYVVSGHHEAKIRLSANRGCFNACCELAETTSDEKWLVKALDISAFDAGARFALASQYETSSPKEALVHHYMLARQGNKSAKERLARMFYDMASDDKTMLIPSMFWACEVTTPKTMKVRALVSLQLDYYDNAFEYMSLVATSPCETGIDAIYEMSRFHVLGTGTPVNETKAQELLEQAAEKGQASAQYDLAMIQLEEDRPRAMKLVREAAKTHVVAMHFLSKFEPDRSLLEKAGTMIPLALYDLAVRYVMDAEKGDTEENYKKAVELLKRAEAMPDPLFECDVLDREEAASLLKKLERRLVVCEKLHRASMDSILRLAQYNNATLLADVVEKKLKN
jgi:TPR repeat protein